MALTLFDRVKETSTTAGTGTIVLAGPANGYQSFAVVGNANQTYYTIAEQTGADWEVGIGTYYSGNVSLARTTILASSNANAAVNFAGTLDVFVTYPAERSVNLDTTSNVSALGNIASATWLASTIGVAYGGTGATSGNAGLNNLMGYTTTATAAGTTTLTATSTYKQYFTGVTTQTVVMPVVTTLALGRSYEIVNNSTGLLTIQSSGLNTITTIPAGISGVVTCAAITGTTAASWHWEYASFDAITGTGSAVFNTSPTLVTPVLGTPSSGTLTSCTGLPLTTGVTGTLPIANGGTNATSAPAAMASLMGFTTTATAAGTTVFTNTSSYYQIFTGTSTQTITLPVTSTLATGWTFHICNNSTGNLTVNSSGGNLVITVLPGLTAMVTCILTSGTTAASWEAGFTDFSTATGTGAVVLATSPTLVTPVLGTPSSGTLTSCTGLPLTTGVTGTLPIANGGTNSTATATAGGVGYGTGTAHAYTAAGTSGQALLSGGAGAPTWGAVSNTAKAWAQALGGTGTPLTINGSFNVSSITRTALGKYVVNFTSNMANINYSAVVSSAITQSQGIFGVPFYSAAGTISAPTVSSFPILYLGTNGAPFDVDYVNFAVFD